MDLYLLELQHQAAAAGAVAAARSPRRSRCRRSATSAAALSVAAGAVAVAYLFFRRSRMPSRAQLERTIAQLDAAIAALPEEVASAEAPNTTIEVRIGTTAMAAADEELVGRIADLINSAYFAALRELLPPHATTYSRVDEDDVYHRLEMGDAGAVSYTHLTLPTKA